MWRSIVSIITFVVSKIAVGIFAGGVVFGKLLPELHITIGNTTIDSFWIGSVLVIVLTGLYTALGGMRAVAYNDAVQTFVLILGSFSLTAYGLVKLGGWHELRYWCGSDMFNLWKPLIPAGVQGTWAPVLQTDAAGNIVKEAWYFNGNFPWVGMLICAPIIGLWYWCTDQYIVQRALGAPNQAVARRGAIFASFLKLFPVYLFIIPGLICYALAKSGKIPALAGIVGPDGKAIPGVAQGAFPMMVQYLLPPGLRGLVVAGLLSALMGSLAGVFNACSTLFTVDLYEKWRPGSSQHQIVRVGRMATAAMVLVALAWIPVIKNAQDLNLLGIARAIGDLAKRAREKKLMPDDVQGGTFTITNPGGYGTFHGTPIISQPQAAILGVGNVEKRPVVVDDAIAIRPMAYLTLGYDHRVIDGAVADEFMSIVKKSLENWDPNAV